MDATKRSTQTVIVSGKGNKKNEAFASALNDVSKKVLKETTEVLIRIEPKEVTIRQANEEVDFLTETIKEPNAVVVPFLSKRGV